MGKQLKKVPEETLDEQDAVSLKVTPDPIDELDEQPATLKKKESTSPSSSVSLERVEPSEKSSEKSTSTNNYEKIAKVLDQLAPTAKPLYDFGRRIISGVADDLPKSIAQGLEVAKSAVAPATVKEYIRTDAYVDFQKYVREKENIKWYQPFDEGKYIDQYADQFMQETGRQEMVKKIAARNPEIVKRRQEVEKYVERQ